MQLKEPIRKTLEILAVSIGISVLNILSPSDPGFIQIFFIPYGLAAVFFSVYYGRRYGALSLGLSFLGITGILSPILALLYDQTLDSSYWRQLFEGAYIPIPVILASVYLFGMTRRGYVNSIESMKTRIRDLTQENNRLKRINDAQTGINRELEERVSKQQDSVTNLYTQIESMNSLDHRKILDTLLHTTQIFTKTRKASIWSSDPSRRDGLSLQAAVGWSEEERMSDFIPLDGSIEGWVFRNRSLFSVRMLLQYENLAKICTDRNLITLPITLGNQVWGVLNIDDIPFENYNLYTEQLLTIIVSLSRSALENALEYESLVRKEETDRYTGLPMFGQLYRYLEDKISGPEVVRGHLSLVILELVNMDKISSEIGMDASVLLLKDLLARMETMVAGRARAFKYKNNNQIAYVFTDLDYDGVGMICLETLGSISEGGFTSGDREVALELILGYAVAGETITGVEQLLESAEQLLEIQKV